MRVASGARRRRLAVASGLFACFATARTASADDGAPIPIVVHGPATASFTSSAREGERPRDAPDAAALLEGLPGLRVRRLGGPSSFATLSIRGAASNQIAVAFAGVPLTGGADPSLDLSTLPLWPGALVRAHRTFAPAALGGGYLGGIVEIQPVDLRRSKTEVENAASSFGTYRLRVADVRSFASTGDRQVTLASGLSATRSAGDFTFYDPNRGVDDVRTNGDLAQVAAVSQLRVDGEHWTTIATGLASARRDGVAGPFDRPARGTRLSRDRQLIALESRRGGDDGRFLVRGWARRDGRTFDDPFGEQGFVPGRARDEILAGGVLLGRSLRLGEDLVVDARIDEAIETAEGVRAGGGSPSRSRIRASASADATWQASRVLSFTIAARGDGRIDRGDGAPTTREILPAAHLGVEATVARGLSIAGHVGRLSRPPSFLELLGDGGLYAAAPDLASERALAADVGIRAQGGRDLRFEFEVVGFGAEIRDLIVLVPIGLRSLRAENVGDARLLGVELSGAASFGPLRAAASYTRLHTEDRTSATSSRGAPLPGRPDHDLTTDLSIAIGPATVRYGIDLVSATTLDRAGLRVLPTRLFHGAGVRLSLASGITALCEVANLFDQRTVDVPFETGARPTTARYPIADFLGYPLPGRRLTVAVRWAL
jgi:hypothetical protein